MRTADKLYHVRQRAGLTQEQLAEIMGVSKQAISKWESGKSNPEIEKLKRYSEQFGVSLDDLLNENVGLEELFKEKETAKENAAQSKKKSTRKVFPVVLLCALILVAALIIFLVVKPFDRAPAQDITEETSADTYPEENRNVIKNAGGKAAFAITKEALSEEINERFDAEILTPGLWIYQEDLCTDAVNVYLYGGDEYLATNKVGIYLYENRSSRMIEFICVRVDTESYAASEDLRQIYKEDVSVLATAVLDVDYKTATESIGNVFNHQTGIAWRNAVIVYTWEEPTLEILMGPEG